MADMLQAVRGMSDVLPQQTPAWRWLEDVFVQCVLQYGYQEIRFPLVENTQLFKRTIGEVTDIVEKEMYTFNDRNGDSLTLRPEGTAGCVRACLEHGLLHNQQQKLWYIGPMFRHERPQKGRYRQFNQFGVEALGIEGVAIELELISISQRLWRALGMERSVQLQINTLGELGERQVYKEQLVAYFRQHLDALDEDSKRRLETNPLRILDSKHPKMQTLLHHAPKLMDALGAASQKRLSELCEGLNYLGINYIVNPYLVRGLDYYGHTVFEWVTEHLGSQATVCAGGRYDNLVMQLGGPSVSAIGFAIGVERLLLLLEQLAIPLPLKQVVSLFLIAEEGKALPVALSLAEKIRNMEPNWQVITNTMGGSFKSQFKKADKSSADFALILGEEELKSERVSIKNLRCYEEQVSIAQSDIIEFFKNKLSRG